MTYRAEITRGWDGEQIAGEDFQTWKDAIDYVNRTAPKHSRHVQGVWSFNEDSSNAPKSLKTVIDFGSHQIFARITEINKEAYDER